MPAGAFDHSGGDRPAAGQRGGVVQVVGLVGQVDGAGICSGSLSVVEPGDGRGPPDRPGDAGGLAVQDGAGVVAYPSSTSRRVTASAWSAASPATNRRTTSRATGALAARDRTRSLAAADNSTRRSTRVTLRRSQIGCRRLGRAPVPGAAGRGQQDGGSR